MEAAQTLGTHEIILRLEKGYETKVAEQRNNFSAAKATLTFAGNGRASRI